MFDKRKDNPVQDEPKAQSPAQPEPIRRTASSPSTIGASIVIQGDVSGDENLIIEGRVEGRVNLPSNDLTVGANGVVSADLTANCVRIDGTVDGNINSIELVTVSRTGKVNGDITAPRVTLEDGAKFKGSIDMDPGERQSQGPQKAPRAAPDMDVEPQQAAS